MFTERRKDRRRRYSFRGHFQRIRQKKGLMRIGLSLCGSAIIAGAFLANCSGESITGPGPASSSSGAGGSNGGDVVTTPVSTESAETSMPIAFDNPCTGEVVQGTMRMHFATEPATNDGKINVHEQTNFGGNGNNKSTGLPTTYSYSGAGTSLYEANPNVTNLKMESTTEQNMTINMRNSASGESSDDYHLHYTEHVTMFFLTFRVSADASNFYMECK
jgi:hypothetical protein